MIWATLSVPVAGIIYLIYVMGRRKLNTRRKPERQGRR